MPRRSGPTLLELATRSARAPSHRSTSSTQPHHEQPPPLERSEPTNESAPPAPEAPAIPRAVRVPMGYLFLAGAGVVALVVGGYLIGYSRASSALRERQRDNAQRELESAVQDPLLEQPPLNTTLLDNPGASGSTSATNASRPDPNRRENADPRTPGMNYFIVARDLPDEARRAAEFLETNGVPATVAPIANSNLRLVIALRPFTGEQLRNGDHLSFRARIQSLGRIWKRDHNGATNWEDAYPEKYTR